jgi:hypothetical protein
VEECRVIGDELKMESAGERLIPGCGNRDAHAEVSNRSQRAATIGNEQRK